MRFENIQDGGKKELISKTGSNYVSLLRSPVRVAGNKSGKPPRPFVLNPEFLIVGLWTTNQQWFGGQLSAK